MIREDSKHTVVETTTVLKLTKIDIIEFLRAKGFIDWVEAPRVGVPHICEGGDRSSDFLDIDDYPIEVSYISKKEYKS